MDTRVSLRKFIMWSTNKMHIFKDVIFENIINTSLTVVSASDDDKGNKLAIIQS